MTTAAILEAILELTPQEQNAMILEIQKAQRTAVRKPYGLAKKYITILCDILEITDFDLHIGKSSFVWVKAMCAYQLYRDGLTITEISKMLGMDSSSVAYYLDKMDNAFSMQKVYKREIEIWIEFKNRIRNENS